MTRYPEVMSNRSQCATKLDNLGATPDECDQVAIGATDAEVLWLLQATVDEVIAHIAQVRVENQYQATEEGDFGDVELTGDSWLERLREAEPWSTRSVRDVLDWCDGDAGLRVDRAKAIWALEENGKNRPLMFERLRGIPGVVALMPIGRTGE